MDEHNSYKQDERSALRKKLMSYGKKIDASKAAICNTSLRRVS